jgi:hypothetical protein
MNPGKPSNETAVMLGGPSDGVAMRLVAEVTWIQINQNGTLSHKYHRTDKHDSTGRRIYRFEGLRA